MTNLFLSITLLTSTNINLIRIDVSNAQPSHVYNIQYQDNLVSTNWQNGWVFRGSDVHSFYDYADTNYMFYRLMDNGTNQ